MVTLELTIANILPILLLLAVIVELKSVSVFISACETWTKVCSPEDVTHTALHACLGPILGTRPGVAYQIGHRSDLADSSMRGRPSEPL